MKTPKLALTLAFLLCGLLSANEAAAQSAACSRLLSQINSTGNGGGKYAAAAAKQRSEISRTQAYANSLGCENRQFLFFGKAAPPECAGVKARISQMQANYNALADAAENSGGGRKAALQAQYEANCLRPAQPQVASAQPQRGLFDAIFNPNQQRTPQYEDMPIDRQDLRGSDSGDDEPARHARGGRVAICVKMLDGGFFPVSYSARGADLEDLDSLCKALCPATDVMVFTWNPNGDLNDAVDINDRSYSELPNKLKFQTKFVPEATCKPAGKNWAEVLGPAEQALGEHSKHDILVTPARAAELSRGKDPSVLAALAGKKKSAAADDAEVEAFTAALSKATAANGTSSGIGGGRPSSGPVISVTQGELQDQVGPDGETRKVRIIAPTL